MSFTGIRTIHLPKRTCLRQRGYGLGALFSHLGTFIRPLLSMAVKVAKPITKRTLKNLGKESVKIGGDILTDLVTGQNLEESIKQRGRKGLKKAKKITQRGLKKVLKETAKSIKGQSGGRCVIPTVKREKRQRSRPNHENKQNRQKKTKGPKTKKSLKKINLFLIN